MSPLFFLMGAAFAADQATLDRVVQVEARVAATAASLDRLRVDLTDRTGFIGHAEARLRFQDAVYAFLVEDYDTAAREFFTLVESGAFADDPMYEHDSEWYLAEALFELHNYELAEYVYKKIAVQETHPFFGDSVRRLLEVYSITGQDAEFYALYEKYVVSGKVQATDLVRYSVAKSFFRQGEYGRAKGLLTQVSQGEWYARSHYLLGTIMVADGNYNDAIAEFLLVSSSPVTSPLDQEVVDLGNLALGRLYYETDQLVESSTYYQLIGRESKYWVDALYEICWTYIKSNDYTSALQSVEIFLLAFPEHPYSAQLKLVRGKLHMKEDAWDAALISFEELVAEYTPIHSELEEIANDPAAAQLWFDSIVALEKVEDYYGKEIPGYAVALLASHPEMERAIAVSDELNRQSGEVVEAEELVTIVAQALSDPTHAIRAFDEADGALRTLIIEITNLRGDLLAAEETWLLSTTSDDAAKAAIRQLGAQRESLSMAASTGDQLSRMNEGYLNLRGPLAAQRKSSNDPDRAAVGARFDSVWNQLAAMETEAKGLLAKLDDLERAEVQRLQAMLATEAANVAREKTDIAARQGEAQVLAAQASADGFAWLSDTFAYSIEQADRGIVDVLWLKKVDVTDRQKAMVDEQQVLLDDVDARFATTRASMPAPASTSGAE